MVEHPAPRTQEDAVLVRRILDGETDLYRILVERYQTRVFYMGRRFFADGEEVEDYVQEVFVRAYRKLRSFSADASFGGWLYTLAYRYALNTKRSRGRLREDYFPEVETASEDDPEKKLLRSETVARVREAVRQLPGLYALLIRLRYYEELSFRRIAEITGVKEGTLKSQVHRSKAMIKRILTGEGGERREEDEY